MLPAIPAHDAVAVVLVANAAEGLDGFVFDFVLEASTDATDADPSDNVLTGTLHGDSVGPTGEPDGGCNARREHPPASGWLVLVLVLVGAVRSRRAHGHG